MKELVLHLPGTGGIQFPPIIGVQSKHLTKCQMQNLFLKNNKSGIKLPKTIKWLTFGVDDKSKPCKENRNSFFTVRPRILRNRKTICNQSYVQLMLLIVFYCCCASR